MKTPEGQLALRACEHRTAAIELLGAVEQGRRNLGDMLANRPDEAFTVDADVSIRVLNLMLEEAKVHAMLIQGAPR